jgi:hypothetical protein
MTIQERNQLTNELLDGVFQTGSSKGAAYAQEGDCLSNFKDVAAMLGLTKYQVWAVYAEKHFIAITNAIRNNPEHPVERTESMRGRIIDGIVYLTILHAMLEEDAATDAESLPAHPAEVQR